jgi:hypothetical protein
LGGVDSRVKIRSAGMLGGGPAFVRKRAMRREQRVSKVDCRVAISIGEFMVV